MAALAAPAVVIAGGEHSDCSVVAFSDKPIVLQSQGRRRPPEDLVGELLTLRGFGTTDLAGALAAAAAQLRRAASPDRLAVLMSDSPRPAENGGARAGRAPPAPGRARPRAHRPQRAQGGWCRAPTRKHHRARRRPPAETAAGPPAGGGARD